MLGIRFRERDEDLAESDSASDKEDDDLDATRSKRFKGNPDSRKRAGGKRSPADKEERDGDKTD